MRLCEENTVGPSPVPYLYFIKSEEQKSVQHFLASIEIANHSLEHGLATNITMIAALHKQHTVNKIQSCGVSDAQVTQTSAREYQMMKWARNWQQYDYTDAQKDREQSNEMNKDWLIEAVKEWHGQ